MTEPLIAAILGRLKAHEGFRSHPYLDTEGVLTIGYGLNLDDGIDQDEATWLLERRLSRAAAKASAIVPGWNTIDPTRQGAFAELAYNLGATRLAKFHKMLAAVAVQDWGKAAAELLDSVWATQVGPSRRDLLVRLVREGK